MAKLKMLGSRIPTMAPRVTTYRPDKVADPFYSSPAWIELRDRVRAESGGHCQKPGCANPGRIVDHVIERKDGGADLDRRNLWLLCTSCHATKTYSVKRQRDGAPAANHPEWLLPSSVPLLIVCGPPASGKTTWAKAQLSPNDILVDLDEIMASLSGMPMYQADRQWLNPAIRHRNRTIAQLAARRSTPQRAALVVAEPTAERREWWAQKLKPTQVVVLETPEATCLQRIASDPRRTARHQEMSLAVSTWWNRYTKRKGDVIVNGDGPMPSQVRVERTKDLVYS